MIADNKRIKILGVLLSISLIISCRNNETTQQNPHSEISKPLFTSVLSDHSGIHFINQIPESSAMNSMVYEYFYNGGGVAIGDINNDGLSDIYFTSNLKENKLYINKGDFRFEDHTKQAKVKGSFGWTTGVTMVDINADGWLDIYVCKSGKGKAENRENELFINNQNGTFTEAAAQYGLNFSGYSTQAAFFDYDKDGDLDMFLLNHNVSPVNTNTPEDYKSEKNDLVGDRLYQNNLGKFTDVSDQVGIIQNALGFGLGVSIGDLNQDGWPDIYVANDYIEHDYLYFNTGNGTFTEKIKSSIGHTSNFSMGTDIADFNNDGLLDIISLDMVAEDNYGIKTSMSGMNPKAFNHAVDNGFHYQYMFNTLQLNNSDECFSEIAHLAGISNTDWSWAPLFADFDNDGLKDVFITNGLKRDFRNNDFRKYKLKRLEQAKKNKESIKKVIEELVRKTPQRKTRNYFFKNNGDLTFSKTSTSWGIDSPTFSNGAAYADLDNDGDLDLVINNIDQEATILQNNTRNKNYVQFQFKGDSQNPFGIGTRITIQTEKTTQIFENYPTRGYQSAVAPVIHVGLDNNIEVQKVTITWPDNKVEVINHPEINKRIIINHNDATLTNKKKKDVVTALFTNSTKDINIIHKHIENEYDDFAKESLLPHKMSQFGPALAVGDINMDGLDDFYIGGAKDHPAALYTQQPNGSFQSLGGTLWEKEKVFEDVSAQFFDVDGDNDLDLYVVSGGNEWPANHRMYQDRLYINTNGNFVKENNRLPKIASSGSCIKPFDYDQDGDLDLFVGSRHTPQKYPYPAANYLLENNNGVFKDITKTIAPELSEIGMVTDATWTDIDQDGLSDLVIVGEWMPITVFRNTDKTFKKDTTLFEHTNGWWNSINSADFDQDGDMDYVVGNLGLNYKYKASAKEPFEIYAHDFDDNGTNDIVLGYYNNGDLFPLRGRECTSLQMPFIKEKFPTYEGFGSADLVQVYGQEKLEKALHAKAYTFASVFIENLGDGKFNIIELPKQAQLSSINDIHIDDFDDDGLKDILVAGNLYQSEIETPRNDAGYGLLLKNNGGHSFVPVPAAKSGILIKGDVKAIRPFTYKGKKVVLFGRNNERLDSYSIK
ncbi:VCBS repeat-containing protein [Aquimarina megaterium]|uniref:VCBS repeat-containing protein n=1 Tax=Aquimarina megaterium TaxID=1443666 RepID=UPI00046FABEB|nr:VCBS repeat-containing protein [Aquimarina megaterium]